MKRKILLMAAIVLCLSISAYGTLAFFVADGPTHNIITSGGVDIEIVEKGANNSIFAQNQTVMPSTTIAKIVTVENKGDTKAWVRVKLDKEMKLTDKEVTPNLDYMELNFAENDKWRHDENDGYWYYREALDAKATTEPLLESVTFAAEMDNKYQNTKAYVNITAEAVQYANNTDGNWPTDESKIIPLDPTGSNPMPPVTDEPDAGSDE